MSVQPPDPPEIRISHADRERAAQHLQRALVEGRISLIELEERLATVYAARYEAELRPPLADLPPTDAAPVVALTPAGPPTVLRTGMSAVRRTGVWAVPARLRVQSQMGAVVLDFSTAEIAHPVVEIELELGAASARLVVPDDATANVDDLVAGMGTVRSSVPSDPRPGVPHFVVHGRAGLGSIRVRRRHRVGRWSF